MDVFWFWKVFYVGLVFGILSTMSCVVGLYINPRMKSIEYSVLLATFSWIMLNVCFLVSDMFASNNNILGLTKFGGFIFTVLGIQSLIRIAVTNPRIFENFKKL